MEKEKEDGLAYRYQSGKVEFWAGMGVICVCVCERDYSNVSFDLDG